MQPMQPLGSPEIPMAVVQQPMGASSPAHPSYTSESMDSWDDPLASENVSLRSKSNVGMWLFLLLLLAGVGYGGWYFYSQSSGVLFERASILVQQKKWQEAEVLLKQVLRQEPNFPGLHRALGHVYFATKRDKEALTMYKRSAPKHPKDGRLHRNLGYLHLQRKEWSEAKRHLSVAQEFRPTDAHIRLYLGMTYIKTLIQIFIFRVVITQITRIESL